MKCPFCGEEMREGKIIGDRYVAKWIPKEDKLVMGIWVGARHIDVGSRRNLLAPGESGDAFVCISCRKLIYDIDYIPDCLKE